MSYRILTSVEDPWIPEGKVYLINELSLFAFSGGFEMPEREDADPYSLDYDQIAFRYRQDFALGYVTEVERDPSLRRPRTLRELLRQMRDVVGYEFRRASGRPRTTTRPDPRSLAVLTGVVS